MSQDHRQLDLFVPRPRRPMNPLLKSPHVYVTRSATLAYQALTGAQFETARRVLTERLLSGATRDPEHKGCFLLPVELPAGPTVLRIWTEREGRLLVVPKVALTYVSVEAQRT